MQDEVAPPFSTSPGRTSDAETLRLLLDAGEALSAAVTVAEVAAVAAEHGAGLARDIECSVGLVVRGRSDRLRLVAATGPLLSALVGREQDLAGSLAGRALRTGRPVESADAARDSPVAAEVGAPPGQTARLVPLRTHAREPATILGVMGYYRAGRPLEPAERAVLDDYTRRVGVALHRAYLLDDARRATRRLSVGVEVALDVAGETNASAVIHRIVARALSAVDADRATLTRVEGDMGVFEDSYALATVPSHPGDRIRLADFAVMDEAVRTSQPVRRSRGEPGFPEAHMDMGMQHLAIVPLLTGGEVVGLLGVARKEGDPFDDDEIAMLRQLAAVGVLVLRSARVLQARTDFMNMAAHELRTPLSVINGYVSMLLDGSFGTLPDAAMAPLRILESRNLEMRRLVDDLLFTARLDSGQVVLVREPVEVVALVEAVAARARPRAALTGGEITVEAPASPLLALADEPHVQRILDNLVNNALVYVRDGAAPRVAIRVESAPDGVRVAVEDSGRGIPEAFHEQVFDRFYRYEDRGSPFVSGTGLGLAMSRDLAERGGGSLVLEWSEPGRGSRFVLTLPAA